MSVEEIRSRISVINAETARLNTQRNQNIGRQEALKKQLEDAFALYKKNYGVDLTSDNLQSELESVTKRKEEELSKIEQILSLINSGNIAEANKLAGIQVDSVNESVPEVVDTSVIPPVTETVVTPPVMETVVTPPVVETPITPPVAPPVMETPITPPLTPPITETPVTPPLTPPMVETPVAPPVLTGAESLEMGMSALEGFTKPSLGSITPPKIEDTPVAPPKTQVQDFSAILSGTAFKPN